MSLHVSIPKIAITPEEENEDDENSFLNLAEALTDVEELFDEQIVCRKNSFKKKLKIKLTESDGYNTALEDVEASDEDDSTPILIQHDCPISMENLDLEQFSTEENYGISQKRTTDFEFFNLQSSKTDDTLQIRPDDLSDVMALTDVEDYDTDNELVDNDEFVIEEFDLDNGEALQITTITDEMQDKQNQVLPDQTPRTPSVFPNTLIEDEPLRPRNKRPPTFSQMMRAKAGQTKMRKRKKNKQQTKKINKQKKASENDSSENESAVKETTDKLWLTNSLNYESDVEEENKLQFPVCKKTFAKKRLQLKMPEFDLNDKTDVEDFEFDIDTTRRRVSVDSTVFQMQLDEMASCYSFTKDKNETKVGHDDEGIQYISHSPNVEDLKNKEEKMIEYPRRYSTNSIRGCEIAAMGCDANSKVKDERENAENDTDIDTEEEEFNGLPGDISMVPDIVLPPPTRTLIIAEENKTLIPTVRILPLDADHKSDSDYEEKSTDDESVDSETDLTTAAVRILHSPQLPMYEAENVKVSENSINPLFSKQAIEEEATDVEELDGESTRSRKKIGADKMFLSPKYTTVNLTDMEELDTSDNRSIRSELEGHTDLEYLDSSDDDTFSKTELQRSRRLSLKLKLPTFNLHLKNLTDTEDLNVSSDDDINYSRAETATPLERRDLEDISTTLSPKTPPDDVMYLRGGGSLDLQNDSDTYFDAQSQIQDVMDAWEYFNCHSETSQAQETFDTTAKDRTMSSDKQEGDSRQQQPSDQHQLSNEMKELLRELEEASKK